MLLKCQINTNTNKKGFLHPTKCLERVLKYYFLVSIILNYHYLKQSLRFFVLFLDFNSISSHFNSISSHFNSINSHLIALTHLNSTKKMHQLLGHTSDLLRWERHKITVVYIHSYILFDFLSEL